MKKLRHLCAALSLLFLLSTLTACASAAPSEYIRITREAVSAAEGTVPSAGPELVDADSDILAVANTALFQKFPDLEDIGLSSFKIEQRRHATDETSYTLNYTLYLCGMYTHESYTVRVIKTENSIDVKDCSGFNDGSFLKFVNRVNPEMIEAAKQDMIDQSEGLTDSDRFYLGISKSGELTLNTEKIVEIFNVFAIFGQSGCGYDHQHVFYTAVICS